MQCTSRGPRPCLDAWLIHAKSSLICSSVLPLRRRIHWLAAKLGCVGTLTEVLFLVSEYFKAAWAASLTLSTLTSAPGSEVRLSLKLEVKCLQPKMWPRPNNCWSYSRLHVPDRLLRLKPCLLGYRLLVLAKSITYSSLPHLVDACSGV